ncbi:hypothetical protein F4777DRAFT_365900 [Nemania sp. FL0916]|nr:hypothetical protein F4777DRAFT_365900 [Nemania sp. FL0916]
MANPDPYPLTRGSQQLTRVNLLQFLWRDTNGYLLHPTVVADGKALRIADVATASGLWLCEVERESPGLHELRGFDISSASFINSAHLPGDMRLEVLDAKRPPPPDLVGTFDVVHVRLVQSVIFDDDPGCILSHCFELLKPGGYLQWEEFDPMAVILHRHDDGAENLQKLTDMLQKRAPASWIVNLPQHADKTGFRVAAVERRPEPPFHHALMTYLFCLVFEEYATTYLAAEGPPGAADDLLKLTRDCFRESQQGSYTEYMFQTVLARKPE